MLVLTNTSGKYEPVDQKYNTKQVLELSCAAQRINGAYLKMLEQIFTDDMKVVAVKFSNKDLVKAMLDPNLYSNTGDHKPQLLKLTKEDVEFAEKITVHYRRLLFDAVEGDNEFRTNLNSILSSEEMSLSQVGYVACLPSMYLREVGQLQVKRASKKVEDGYLGEISEWLTDLDCEILMTQRSKNFDAWNIDAIINNKMVSWMSKNELKPGACVIVKAKVKDHSKHWKHENPVTRLNYVKAAQ